MVEYSVISHFMLLSTAGALLFAFRVFMDALNVYIEGIYAVLAAATI